MCIYTDVHVYVYIYSKSCIHAPLAATWALGACSGPSGERKFPSTIIDETNLIHATYPTTSSRPSRLDSPGLAHRVPTTFRVRRIGRQSLCISSLLHLVYLRHGLLHVLPARFPVLSPLRTHSPSWSSSSRASSRTSWAALVLLVAFASYGTDAMISAELGTAGASLPFGFRNCCPPGQGSHAFQQIKGKTIAIYI